MEMKQRFCGVKVAIGEQTHLIVIDVSILIPSAIDSESIEPLSVLHSKLKFEW